MIKDKTVLVLGAGASMPFGFPSGQLLKDLICQKLRMDYPEPSPRLRELLLQIGFKDDHIEDFRQSLLRSPISSVDAFLEHSPDFKDVGKVAISKELLDTENEFQLFAYWQSKRLAQWKGDEPVLSPGVHIDDDNWYQLLFTRLNAPFDDFEKNNICIITFNYDRSLEHYLFTGLRYTYKKAIDECAEKLKAIKIIHVHGSLGPLPWQQSDNAVPYKGRATIERVKVASQNIKIIPEANTKTDEFDLAFEELKSAKDINFLGFGYHETNMTRLGLKELGSGAPVSGTIYGLSAQDIYRLRNLGLTYMQENFHRFVDERVYQFLNKKAVFH